MAETASSELNPWIAIWTEPRATIQQIVDGDPKHLVLILAPLAGAADALTRNSELAFSSEGAFVGLALVGAVLGFVMLYVYAYLLRWTGKWLGGTGELVAIRAVYVWSSIPKIVSGMLMTLVWVVLALTPGPVAGIDIAVMLMIVTLGAWSFVLHCKCLGQVQGFSAWKGLANSLLATLAVIVPIAGVGILFSVLLAALSGM